MNVESQLYEQRLINSSLNLPQLPKNAWDSPLQETQMTPEIWIYSGNLNLVSRSNSAVDCFCWMWKVWLALRGNHTVAKAPAEVGQSKIAPADTKWKEMRPRTGFHETEWNKRGEQASTLCNANIVCVRCLICGHNYNAGALGFGRHHHSTICHPPLSITAIHIGHFRVLTREWALHGGDDLGQGCQVGKVGRVNMIALGLELSNTKSTPVTVGDGMKITLQM